MVWTRQENYRVFIFPYCNAIHFSKNGLLPLQLRKNIFGHNNLTLNSPILDMNFSAIFGTNDGTQKWPAVKKPTNRLNGNQHLGNMAQHEILLLSRACSFRRDSSNFFLPSRKHGEANIQILRRLALNCCLS